jgi:hypothetical protein
MEEQHEEDQDDQHKKPERRSEEGRLRRMPDILPVRQQDFLQRRKPALRAEEIRKLLKGNTNCRRKAAIFVSAIIRTGCLPAHRRRAAGKNGVIPEWYIFTN